MGTRKKRELTDAEFEVVLGVIRGAIPMMLEKRVEPVAVLDLAESVTDAMGARFEYPDWTCEDDDD